MDTEGLFALGQVDCASENCGVYRGVVQLPAVVLRNRELVDVMVYNAEQVTSAALVIQSARGVVQCLSLSDTQTRREFLLSARDAGGHVSVTELSSGAHSDAGKLVAVAAQLCPTLSQKLEIRMHGDDDEGGERATLLQRASGRSIKLAARDGY